MHVIFQRHNITPDEIFAKEQRHRAFIYASTELQIEAEDKERRIQEQRRNARKGGK